MFTDLPLELIGEIAGRSRLAYHPLVLAYPAFARSLTLGDRLDFAEKFGYDCRVRIGWCDWTLHGELHRTDGPARVCGMHEEWYSRGKRHRDGGPAINRPSGESWYYHGELHREDGPAVATTHVLHSWTLAAGDPPTLITMRYVYWYTHGKARADIPCNVITTTKEWHEDGVLHRDGAPAVIRDEVVEKWAGGRITSKPGTPEWYTRGVRQDAPGKI